MLLTLFGLASAADVWTTPTVVLSEIATTPSLPAEDAWTALSAVGPKLVACFADPHAPVPTTVTRVNVVWTVSDAGRATQLRLDEAEAAPGLRACLDTAIGEARFNSTAGGALVKIALTVNASSPASDQLTRADPMMVLGIGGVIGTKGAEMGSGGLGSRGAGVGGGGTAEGIGGLGRSQQGGKTTTTVNAVSEGLSNSDVADAWAAQLPAVSACWDAAAGGDALEGNIQLGLVFGNDGGAERVSVEQDSTRRTDLAACVAKAARGVRLTAGGTATVSTSYTFTPSSPPSLTLGNPTIQGALKKSAIDAVLKRNVNQLLYCYQRTLQGTPELAGTVTVEFVVAPDGFVQSATTPLTTMNNSAVESCIQGRFLRFQFPSPAGGGIVTVSYPLTFKPN